MNRLTQRDRKGKAYFDNDGVLICGANGIFHQKKDMTAHYIHDRFVALDKVIDRLAAYEDSGLEPDEVKALVNEQKNEPLTIEEMKDLLGEPVWLEDEDEKRWDVLNYFGRNFICMVSNYSYNICDYGKTWIAYRQKKGVK